MINLELFKNAAFQSRDNEFIFVKKCPRHSAICCLNMYKHNGIIILEIIPSLSDSCLML